VVPDTPATEWGVVLSHLAKGGPHFILKPLALFSKEKRGMSGRIEDTRKGRLTTLF
jgi:hypothetical protein